MSNSVDVYAGLTEAQCSKFWWQICKYDL